VKRYIRRRFRRAASGWFNIAAFFITLLSAFVLIESTILLAQDSGKSANLTFSESQAPAARFLVHSDLVLVPVTVTTHDGRIVPGLAKEDFTIYDDNVPQLITHFTSEDAPATIGLVFDCSDSMAGPKLARAQKAATALLANAHPQDEFFVVRFSDRPELLVQATNQTDRIRSAVDSLEAHGFTAVLDAVKAASMEMSKQANRRKGIILFSDGEDNHSHTTAGELQQLLMENNTTIYTLFITSSWYASPMMHGDRSSGEGLLDSIARQSGGRMFIISEIKQLPQIAAKIGSWIRSQYVLGYVPSGPQNGSYHRIQVKITKPGGFPKLHASWRLGYYAPAP
jgi:Ca-activated chloride channel homolog